MISWAQPQYCDLTNWGSTRKHQKSLENTRKHQKALDSKKHHKCLNTMQYHQIASMCFSAIIFIFHFACNQCHYCNCCNVHHHEIINILKQYFHNLWHKCPAKPLSPAGLVIHHRALWRWSHWVRYWDIWEIFLDELCNFVHECW